MIAALFIFGFSYCIGMSIWVIFIFFAIDYAIFIALSRARAELGPPFHNLWGVTSSQIMVNVFGSKGLGPRNLIAMSLFYFFNRNHLSHPMPEYLENLKIGESADIRLRNIMVAMMLATIVAIPLSFLILLHLSYKFGAQMTFAGWESFNALHQQLSYFSKTNYKFVFFMVLGFFFIIVLTVMRMRFFWWPFHPAGYALSINFGMDWIWFCLVISFLIKWIILKHWGLKAHRRAVSFFIGLILGEFVVGSFWSALSIVIQRPTYTFWIF